MLDEALSQLFDTASEMKCNIFEEIPSQSP